MALFACKVGGSEGEQTKTYTVTKTTVRWEGGGVVHAGSSVTIKCDGQTVFELPQQDDLTTNGSLPTTGTFTN